MFSRVLTCDSCGRKVEISGHLDWSTAWNRFERIVSALLPDGFMRIEVRDHNQEQVLEALVCGQCGLEGAPNALCVALFKERTRKPL